MNSFNNLVSLSKVGLAKRVQGKLENENKLGKQRVKWYREKMIELEDKGGPTQDYLEPLGKSGQLILKLESKDTVNMKKKKILTLHFEKSHQVPGNVNSEKSKKYLNAT